MIANFLPPAGHWGRNPYGGDVMAGMGSEQDRLRYLYPGGGNQQFSDNYGGPMTEAQLRQAQAGGGQQSPWGQYGDVFKQLLAPLSQPAASYTQSIRPTVNLQTGGAVVGAAQGMLGNRAAWAPSATPLGTAHGSALVNSMLGRAATGAIREVDSSNAQVAFDRSQASAGEGLALQNFMASRLGEQASQSLALQRLLSGLAQYFA